MTTPREPAEHRRVRRTLVSDKAESRGFTDGYAGCFVCPYTASWAVEAWRRGYKEGQKARGES